jgi:hypothetical protein
VNNASYVLWALAHAIYATFSVDDADAAWHVVQLLGALRDQNDEQATRELFELNELVGIRTIVIREDGQ